MKSIEEDLNLLEGGSSATDTIWKVLNRLVKEIIEVYSSPYGFLCFER